MRHRVLYKQPMGGTSQGASRSTAVLAAPPQRGPTHPQGSHRLHEHRKPEHRDLKAARRDPEARPQTPQARPQAQQAQAPPPPQGQAPAHARCPGGGAAERSRDAPGAVERAGFLAWRAAEHRGGPAAAVARGLRADGPAKREALAGQPLQQVVYGLTRPSGEAVLSGPAPTDEEGKPLDPAHTWGDDHCWWLDRMVRSDQQLVERMTFIWHDWFANSNGQVNSSQLMLDQNQLFRETGARQLLRPVPGGHRQPRDAGVPRRDRQREGGLQRELRARDDGALLAGRRPRRVHRGRRARNGARADRLAGGMVLGRRDAQLPLRPLQARRRPEDRVRADGQLGLGRRGEDVRFAPAAPLVLRHQAMGLLHPHASPTKRRRPRYRASTRARASASGRWSRRFSSTPTSTKARSS